MNDVAYRLAKTKRKGTTMSFDPTLGRFMEEDPDRYVDGSNIYQYEKSNPVDRLDPSGLAIEITWSNGNTEDLGDPAVGTLLLVLQAQLAAGITATNITITGHGAEQLIEPGGSDGSTLTATNGSVLKVDKNGVQTDITAELQRSIATNGSVDLQGCHTSPLAKEFAAALPGRTVTGAKRFAMRVGPNTVCWSPVTYKNPPVPGKGPAKWDPNDPFAGPPPDPTQGPPAMGRNPLAKPPLPNAPTPPSTKPSR